MQLQVYVIGYSRVAWNNAGQEGQHLWNTSNDLNALSLDLFIHVYVSTKLSRFWLLHGLTS
jgi:hypothetical protein